jgi:hypothetical protein
VRSVDDLMKASRKAAPPRQGDVKAAIANRSKLLQDLKRVSSEGHGRAREGGVAGFTAAIRESLRQNRECAEGAPRVS